MLDHDLEFPETLTGQELDEYLSRGWYRTGRLMFSTKFLGSEDHPVTWLRMDLPRVKFGKSQRRVLRKNSQFAVSVSTLNITPEIESLFDLHKHRIDFAGSVAEYLMDGPFDGVFNTHQFEVRDDDLLIAVGFLDLGEVSTAAILNFFNPAYSRYGLGIYLLLLEIQFSIAVDMKWFYPGYIVKGNSKFDYKLFPDREATEKWDDHEKQWRNHFPFSNSSDVFNSSDA